jgi:CRISPR-associated exonuclease Cas4
VEPIPLSALNDFLFCPRRAGLKFIEGLRGTNEHTILGDLAHAHVDFPGYEQRAGWTLLRALPVFSDRLGLSGKADLVEVHRDDSTPRILDARPVEYKKGPRRRFDNDEVQLCAQALCLEEMFGLSINAGAIYHAQSERRTEIVFDDTLRRQTLDALAALRALLATSVIPVAELKPQCEGCSLHTVCLPEASGRRAPRLYEPRDYV